jgi:hypothetical protein
MRWIHVVAITMMKKCIYVNLWQQDNATAIFLKFHCVGYQILVPDGIKIGHKAKTTVKINRPQLVKKYRAVPSQFDRLLRIFRYPTSKGTFTSALSKLTDQSI